MNGKAFSLEFHCHDETIFVRGNECAGREQPTLKHVEKATISLPEAMNVAGYMSGLIRYAVEHGRLDRNDLARLREKGGRLFDDFFPPAIKSILDAGRHQTLILGLDDHLVGIPWELLHDGKSFLSLRYAMGRVVSTRHPFSGTRQDMALPLRMLILADPRNNLPSSRAEGVALRDMLDERTDLVNVSFIASSITTEYVKEKLRVHDIVHYAGHADYDGERPERSGLLLADKKLTAGAIQGMVDRMAFPSFVFLNGCQSGQTGQWRENGGYEKVYGLANAFLLAGVRHYLGTFWEIQDEPGSLFAHEFYGSLLEGATIGEAVRKARVRLAGELGEENIIWGSYMLYGDPSFHYIRAGGEKIANGADEKKVTPTPCATPGSPPPRTRSIASFSRPLSSVPIISGLAILALACLAVFLYLMNRPGEPTGPRQPARIERSQDNEEITTKSRERVDRKIKELAEKFRRTKPALPERRPAWDSSPLSLVFLDIATEGGLSRTEAKFIVSTLIEEVERSRRVRVVDRTILEELIDELRLSSTELADPATALKLGRVLSARLIIDSAILLAEDRWVVDLKIIDTESTRVVGAVPLDEPAGDASSIAAALSEGLIARIARAFPIQGKIIDARDGMTTINVGSDVGVEEGMEFEVLSDSGPTLGSLKADAVKAGETRVLVPSGANPAAGLRVREKGTRR